MQNRIYCIVATALRVDDFLHYWVKTDAVSEPKQLLGRRVLVSVQSRTYSGVIINLLDEQVASKLAYFDKIIEIKQLCADMPALSSQVLSTLDFCSRYYLAKPPDLYLNMLAPKWREAKIWSRGLYYQLAPDCSAKDVVQLDGQMGEQRAMPRWWIENILATSQTDQTKLASAVFRKLVTKGVLRLAQPPQAGHKYHGNRLITPKRAELTEQQAESLKKINSSKGVWVLAGMPGSGKTHTLIHGAARTVAGGEQVLYLVPEIHMVAALTHQMNQAYPHMRIVQVHSAMGDLERSISLHKFALGEADVLICTISGVFAPAAKLGLIVVDEEHDSAYKQSKSPYLHARDGAVCRARYSDAKIILASATVSGETLQNCYSGKYNLLQLTRRYLDNNKLTLSFHVPKGSNDIDSEVLARIKREIQGNDQAQVLVFINRVGYASSAYCEKCAQNISCDNCGRNPRIFLRKKLLQCDFCKWEQKYDGVCPDCEGEIVLLGGGTERAEDTLRALERSFADFSMFRFDRANEASLEQNRHMLQQAAAGKIKLLLGTQMISKGYNFPYLSSIVVLGTDQALFAPDFRAKEKAFSLLCQVIGRGSRIANRCEALVVTKYPNDPFYQALAQKDYLQYLNQVLQERQQYNLPPYCTHCMLRADSTQPEQLEQFFVRTMKICVHLLQEKSFAQIKVYDQQQQLSVRSNRREYWSMLLSGLDKSQMAKFALTLRAQMRADKIILKQKKVRWSFEKEPYDWLPSL